MALVPKGHGVWVELAQHRPVGWDLQTRLNREVREVVQIMRAIDNTTRQDDSALDELLTGLLGEKTDRLGRRTPALDQQSAGQMIATACLKQLSGLGNRKCTHGLDASNSTLPLFKAL